MATALITGPTAGIGRAIARELAARGIDLILVARSEDGLRQVAGELPVDCEVLVADLADRTQLQKVEAAARDVDWLVNNAGFGFKEPFIGSTVEQEQALLDVLVTAPMRLTHAALPGMIDRGFGRVLNVSSVAAQFPMGTYSAAKAWLSTFSESLATTTPDHVHVTALLPGFTRTEFHKRAHMAVKGPSWMWLDADFVARAGVNDCEKGAVFSVPGWQYRSMNAAAQFTPHRVLRWGVARGM